MQPMCARYKSIASLSTASTRSVLFPTSGMIRNQRLPCLFGISACIIAYIVAVEAMIGGDHARPGQFPYQVSLQVDGNHICGGGIINENLVITAAHCLYDEHLHRYHHIEVVAATIDLHNPEKTAVRNEVAKAYLPRDVDLQSRPPNDDFAILKMRNHFITTYHGNIQRLILPRSQRESFEGKTATIAGFGWNWFKITHPPTAVGNNTNGRLRFAESKVLAPHCLPVLNDRHLCAKVIQRHHVEPRGTCLGDSGGPLVDEHKYVIGILSVSPIGCNEAEHPAIYTRVANYLTMIRYVKENKNSTSIFELDYEKKNF